MTIEQLAAQIKYILNEDYSAYTVGAEHVRANDLNALRLMVRALHIGGDTHYTDADGLTCGDDDCQTCELLAAATG